MTKPDPLEGADVGETRTVRESVKLHTINFEPDVFYGTDRFGTPEIESVDVVDGEHGDKTLVVNFEGEITKALPERWDYCREPLTEAEENAQRRKQWAKKAARAVGIVAPVAITMVVAGHVMQQMSGITVNGEPMQPPSIEAFAAIGGLILFFAWAIQYLPGRFGGRVA